MKVIDSENATREALFALMASLWECDRIETDKRISPHIPDLMYSIDRYETRGLIELKFIDGRLPSRSYHSGLTRGQALLLMKHGKAAGRVSIVIGIAPWALIGFHWEDAPKLLKSHKLSWYRKQGVLLDSNTAYRFFTGRTRR